MTPEQREQLRTETWWALTGYYNDRGIIPSGRKIERMVDLAIEQVEREREVV